MSFWVENVYALEKIVNNRDLKQNKKSFFCFCFRLNNCDFIEFLSFQSGDVQTNILPFIQNR